MMNTDTLMRYGAIAFAGFAAWYVLRKPSGTTVAATPAQAQRDNGLQAWTDLNVSQALEFDAAAVLNRQHLADFFPTPTPRQP